MGMALTSSPHKWVSDLHLCIEPIQLPQKRLLRTNTATQPIPLTLSYDTLVATN